MQVWNVLHAARWKYSTQKIAICAPSHNVVGKKLVKQQYFLHVSPQYGELRPTNGWDWLVSLGHPSQFQRVSRLGFDTVLTLLIVGQPNFGLCSMFGRLVSWYTIYTFSLSLTRCKIHFASKSCVLLYWQRYCTTLEHWVAAKICGVVQGIDLRNFRSSSFSLPEAKAS